MFVKSPKTILQISIKNLKFEFPAQKSTQLIQNLSSGISFGVLKSTSLFLKKRLPLEALKVKVFKLKCLSLHDPA